MFFRRRSLHSRNVLNELEVANNYSMSGIQVLNTLYAISKRINEKNIKGDIVECGVWNGGSAAALSMPIISSNKKLWLYDSFEGMPTTTEIDGEEAKKYIGACVGDEKKVLEILNIVEFPINRVIIKKGWFKDTFADSLPNKISVLHIDSDWYDSVTMCLDTFYDLVEMVGVIILDDFGHWEGCREAFYDFAHKKNIKPLFERFGHTQMYWIKGRTHNRDFRGQTQGVFI
jgi:O-methyltransferase